MNKAGKVFIALGMGTGAFLGLRKVLTAKAAPVKPTPVKPPIPMPAPPIVPNPPPVFPVLPPVPLTLDELKAQIKSFIVANGGGWLGQFGTVNPTLWEEFWSGSNRDPYYNWTTHFISDLPGAANWFMSRMTQSELETVHANMAAWIEHLKSLY